jgi:hypothetical protein
VRTVVDLVDALRPMRLIRPLWLNCLS